MVTNVDTDLVNDFHDLLWDQINDNKELNVLYNY